MRSRPEEITSERSNGKRFRLFLALFYATCLLTLVGLILLIPLPWLSFILGTIFLYIICLYMIQYLELKPEATPHTTEWPSVTVLIPAYNRGESLLTCITKIKALQYPKKIQIIVINDASTDQTRELLSNIKGIQTIHLSKNGGKANALNMGLSKAKGEIVAVVDGDSYPNEDALMRSIPHFKKENVGAVTSIVRVNNPNGMLQKIQEVEYAIGFGLYNTVLSSMDSLFVTPGPFSIYQRKVLERTKGFDTRAITEDMEITFHLHQLGYRIIMDPEVHVYSDVPTSVHALFRQRIRWFRGGLETLYKYRNNLFSKSKLFFRFFYPMRLFMEITALIFLFVLVRLWYETLDGSLASFMALYSTSFELIPWPTWTITGTSVYTLFMTLVTISFVIFGANLMKRDRPKFSLPALALFIFVYGIFISVIYFISLTQTILGVEKRW
ncbi:MAG: glycosyltransferase family 2 protein [Candidatus Diapherotrites archaeon]|uniref:Glycosyltransferase family 2 protein n=1 Tax=Candidatus Iainarchaeum sp. TaxID=3101447 RepID=A0A8T4C6H6_9ARCH|nr:glycosyltransferase family 2 protein [Candidatus Diapherotrites archaeon]